MRVPPFRHSKNWDRFFFGTVIGALLSWLIFLFMFGEMQEQQAKTIREQREMIADLEKEKKIWQEEFQKLNEKNMQMLTVQEIVVKIANGDKYKLDRLSVFEIEERIKESIGMILAKDLNLVFNSRELIRNVVEYTPIKVNDKRYRAVIKEMVIYTTVTLQLELVLDG